MIPPNYLQAWITYKGETAFLNEDSCYDSYYSALVAFANWYYLTYIFK